MALSGFMKFSKVEGVSTDENHKDWFHIDTCGFSIQNVLKSQHQDSEHRGTFSAITITRSMDEASNQLMKAAEGNEVGDCSISFTKSNIGNSHPLVALNLKDAQITGYSTEMTSKGITEHLELHFGSFHYEYAPVSRDQKQMPACVFECDIQH